MSPKAARRRESTQKAGKRQKRRVPQSNFARTTTAVQDGVNRMNAARLARKAEGTDGQGRCMREKLAVASKAGDKVASARMREDLDTVTYGVKNSK